MRVMFAVAGAVLMMATAPVEAAVGTTCLCRSDDGKGFKELTVRHHRWACDYALGYVKDTVSNKGKLRPTTQTCNADEITQFKVYRCMSSGCTYPYAQSTDKPNTALEKIEPMRGPRRP
jgi:hypothetical protein